MHNLIIGANGSMGKRYQAIFKYLNVPMVCVDKEDSLQRIITLASESSRILICTPTHTHYDLIKELLPIRVPILCEKPITKSLEELEDITASVERHGYNFNMVFQYEEMIPQSARDTKLEPSFYNYFRHGSDGLVWDCLQIIALANSAVTLGETSPFWQCAINGYMLDLSKMDFAYVFFIQQWLFGNLKQNPEWLYNIHEKTKKLKDSLNESGPVVD